MNRWATVERWHRDRDGRLRAHAEFHGRIIKVSAEAISIEPFGWFGLGLQQSGGLTVETVWSESEELP